MTEIWLDMYKKIRQECYEEGDVFLIIEKDGKCKDFQKFEILKISPGGLVTDGWGKWIDPDCYYWSYLRGPLPEELPKDSNLRFHLVLISFSVFLGFCLGLLFSHLRG
jgi:hypothetical protein